MRRAISQTASASYVSEDTNHDKSIVLTGTLSHDARHNDSVLDKTASCTNYTHEEYITGCGQFWADVPHETFTPVATKTKKPRKKSVDLRCVGGQEKRWHRPKKKKRKKEKAYLVSE